VKEGSPGLAEGRLAKAKARVVYAKDARKGWYDEAVTRAYYAILAAMRALLALKRFDSKSHEGVIHLFNTHYVKTGLFSKEFIPEIERARNRREHADYDEVAPVSADDARRQINAAAKFVAAVEKYFKEKNAGNEKPKKKARR
jgi:uncharacterized protein (UPF0332 family)